MNKTIKDVEIFAAGTHNGDTYTELDLDEMVNNFDKVGFMPPIKDGHCGDKEGMPALGWIQNLKRVGKKLVADFVDVHPAVYEAIKNRRYDRVSAEIYWNLKNGVKGTFKKVLKAVALLGADIPAVGELKPLREVVFEDNGAEVKRYTLLIGGFVVETDEERQYRIESTMEKYYQDLDIAQAAVDTKTKAYMEKHTGIDYVTAMHRVLEEDPELKRAYAGMEE